MVAQKDDLPDGNTVSPHRKVTAWPMQHATASRRVGNLPTIPTSHAQSAHQSLHLAPAHGGRIAHPTPRSHPRASRPPIPALPARRGYPGGSTKTANPRPAPPTRASPDCPNNIRHARQNPPRPGSHRLRRRVSARSALPHAVFALRHPQAGPHLDLARQIEQTASRMAG